MHRKETILVVACSVDDCSPQIIGYVLERALELGALDAYATPLLMKKQRPGVEVTLLARPGQRTALVALLLEETTTLGVRVGRCERVVAPRRMLEVETEYGRIRVKCSGDKLAPEYEDCRAAARRGGVPLRRVQAAAIRSAAGYVDNVIIR
ncbi:MAG: nickel insertion protein [Terriglobales bacterium]